MSDSPGMVGVIAQETARYTMFSASLTSTEMPEGSKIKWMFGHSIADNCNALVRALFEAEAELGYGFEWFWLLGDDHTWSPPLLNRLLAHDVDIVVPLCLMRSPPYKPVIFSGFENEATYVRRRVALDSHPFGGLIPIHSAGSAGMLIRRHVLEAMFDPWFEAAVLDSQQLGEDLYFCDKARDLGFEIFCDLDASLGHCINGVVWPVREGNGWTYGFSMTGGFTIRMPRG